MCFRLFFRTQIKANAFALPHSRVEPSVLTDTKYLVQRFEAHAHHSIHPGYPELQPRVWPWTVGLVSGITLLSGYYAGGQQEAYFRARVVGHASDGGWCAVPGRPIRAQRKHNHRRPSANLFGHSQSASGGQNLV
jgi:hypothetical protein